MLPIWSMVDKQDKDEINKLSERVGSSFERLVGIVTRLRAPGGCPWDREQTSESLKPFFIEETYEALDAIDSGNPRELCEELGDVLLQVALHAQIASEQGHFDAADVADAISDKLITRHPHVFGEIEAPTSGQVLQNWESIKKKEKRGRGLFAGLPAHLPALQKAARMGEKAGRVGFDWTNPASVRDKVVEELAEFDEAVADGDEPAMRHEVGDLLFAVAQWARHLGIEPEEALRQCCARFESRFTKMEKRVECGGQTLGNQSLEQLEELWQQAKKS